MFVQCHPGGGRRRVATLIVAVALGLPAVMDAAAHEGHGQPQPAAVTDVPEAPAAGERPATREAGHEHAPRGVPAPLAWLGRFHPPLTHFPIALLDAAALAELLLMRRGGALFEHAVRFCVGLGALTAIGAGLLGWLFGGFQLSDDEWLMTAHRWLGTATALWAGPLFAICERTYARAASRRLFRFALFGAAGLVSATGFLGGALLYGLDHFAW